MAAKAWANNSSFRTKFGGLFLFLQLQSPIQQSDSVRDAFSRTLSKVAAARSESERSAGLAAARRLAARYATTWRDDFLIRQADRFAQASADTRRHLVISDSLRRSGNTALLTEGINKAMPLWRASMQHAIEANDDAAKASARVSLGGGLYRLGELDSATAYLTVA